MAPRRFCFMTAPETFAHALTPLLVVPALRSSARGIAEVLAEQKLMGREEGEVRDFFIKVHEDERRGAGF